MGRKACDILLGIIDTKGIDRSKYRNTDAAFKKFGDRKPGAITLTIRKNDLDKFLDAPKAIFPPERFLQD